MRNMSYALTTSQFITRTKFATRRLGWKDLKPGTRLMGVEKGMGLKKGEKAVRLGQIIALHVKREPLLNVTKNDCILEGFPEKTPNQFISMFCKHNKCAPYDQITTIEYGYMNTDGTVTIGYTVLSGYDEEDNEVWLLETKDLQPDEVEKHIQVLAMIGQSI